MNDNDLSNIWVCSDCRMSFAFEADVTDHKQETGHTKIVKTDLDSFGSIINNQTKSDLEWRKRNR